METITLPKTKWVKIEKALERMEEAANSTIYINESEAAQLLGITRQTLSNYLYNGRIPMDFYTTGVGGNKFFDKTKLMGLKK